MIWRLFHRPLTLESMKSVEGVSEIWLQKYGEKFLQTIGSFCQTKEIQVPMDAHLSAVALQRTQSAYTIVKVCLYINCKLLFE